MLGHRYLMSENFADPPPPKKKKNPMHNRACCIESKCTSLFDVCVQSTCVFPVRASCVVLKKVFCMLYYFEIKTLKGFVGPNIV